MAELYEIMYQRRYHAALNQARQEHPANDSPNPEITHRLLAAGTVQREVVLRMHEVVIERSKLSGTTETEQTKLSELEKELSLLGDVLNKTVKEIGETAKNLISPSE